jgi:translation elongation factor EF-1beta
VELVHHLHTAGTIKLTKDPSIRPHLAKPAKKGLVPKSIIIWEVKPWGEETDLDALGAKILAITMDGLQWKTEFKKEPIAYGVMKIVIGAVVEDDKVSTDLVEEAIMAFEDDVQSVDI